MLEIKGIMVSNEKKCFCCKKVRPIEEMRHVADGLMVCSGCMRVKDYSTPNTMTAGKGERPLASVEFEISRTDPRQWSLLKHGFLPASDSSVEVEFKSPIYYSWKMLHSVCVNALDPLKDLVGDRAGTHIHMGCERELKNFVTERWPELYTLTSLYMKDHERTTAKVFGRTFNDYAIALRGGSGSFNRHVWINPTSRHNTLEFRLLKFKSANQYYAAARICYALLKETEKQFKSEKCDDWAMLETYRSAMKRETTMWKVAI